jgi:hypothetical protein
LTLHSSILLKANQNLWSAISRYIILTFLYTKVYITITSYFKYFKYIFD